MIDDDKYTSCLLIIPGHRQKVLGEQMTVFAWDKIAIESAGNPLRTPIVALGNEDLKKSNNFIPNWSHTSILHLENRCVLK